MSEYKISKFWEIMPLFSMLHKDSDYDDSYVFKGYAFICSIVLLPLTLPCFFIGLMFRRK